MLMHFLQCRGYLVMRQLFELHLQKVDVPLFVLQQIVEAAPR